MQSLALAGHNGRGVELDVLLRGTQRGLRACRVKPTAGADPAACHQCPDWCHFLGLVAHEGLYSASVLKNRRVVFNITGNDYRLIVAVAYKLQIVYVKFVGTHKAYDAVDAETVEVA